MKIWLQILFSGVFLFFSQAYASSCNWTEQIKYPNDSIGCLAELPFANEIVKEEKVSVIEYLRGSTTNAVAISNMAGCKAMGISSKKTPTHLRIYHRHQSEQPQVALDRCMNQGCDCELVIVDSISKIDKISLFARASGDMSENAISTKAPSKETAASENKVKDQVIHPKKDDDQIAILRKELEKEIRSRLLAEESLKKSTQEVVIQQKVLTSPKYLLIVKPLLLEMIPIKK